MSPEAAARLLEDPPGPQALNLLRRQGLAEPERAARELRLVAADERLRGIAPSELLPLVLSPLAEVPDPDSALARLERLVRAGGAGVVLSLRQGGPQGARALLWALGGSPFLAEQLIRHPEWAERVTRRQVLARARGAGAIAGDAREAIGGLSPEDARDALRRARRREIVHVAIRDLLRLSSVAGTLAALTAIADALLPVALEIAAEEARAELRLPPRRGGGATPGFVVLALGKLGGSELNFSSDVDLVYVHRADFRPVSHRKPAVDRHGWAEVVARRLTSVLGEATEEGHVYRVDLRLRPEGRAGAISHSLGAAEDYYRRRGAAWERLALLKARPVAGDTRLGNELRRRVSGFVWTRPFDADALRQVLRMKHEADRRLVARGLEDRHVKLGRGGIREIELVAQVLQIRHGRASRLRAASARPTLAVLDALRSLGALPPEEAGALAAAYLFLRDVENKLQMVHDAQTHVVSADDDEVRLLARRLGYGDEGGHGAGHAVARFRTDFRGHTETVHRLFGEILGRLVSSGTAP